TVRRLVLSALNSAVRTSCISSGSTWVTLLPSFYKETVIVDLIRIGAQMAYETMYTLVSVFNLIYMFPFVLTPVLPQLDTCLATLEPPTFSGRMLPGLVHDSDEIMVISQVAPTAVSQ
ncbi:hypothetical protein C8J57DRAFT_1013157, partial [Mycena rebaudengoi]